MNKIYSKFYDPEPEIPLGDGPLKDAQAIPETKLNHAVVLFKNTKRNFNKRSYLAYREKGQRDKAMSNLMTPIPFSEEGKLFYEKRYFLFSRFDRGILIDEESKF